MPSVVREVAVENLLSGRRMLIEWTANSSSESVTAYEIWRSTMEYQGFEKIAEVVSPTVQYIDKVPYTFGIVFYYKILARDATGLRSDITQSNPVSDITFDDFEERPFRATNLSYGAYVSNEIPVGAIDGVNKTFTVANLFRFGSVQVHVNGLLTAAFTEGTNQTSFTLVTAPAVSSVVVASYLKL